MEGEELEALLRAVSDDWRAAKLSSVDRALCVYAEKLTGSPSEMTGEDLAALRVVGLDDTAIHEAIQVISYFNYINRVADASHVDLEPEMPGYPAQEAPAGS